MAANLPEQVGKEAILVKGWWHANKWLLLRRTSQLLVIAIFLTGPLLGEGYWIAKGNLTSSLTFDILPLTDPYVLLQSFFAGHEIISQAFIGAVIVTVFYFLVGGRVFCSWVCPVNIVTDTADGLRRKWNIKGGARFSRDIRYWVLAMTLIVAVVTGSIAWELINPVSILHRSIIFGFGYAALVILAIFIFDLLLSRQGWCGHLCPVGAFYSLLGRISFIRVSAPNRENCDDCMDCFLVCPEKQVIKPALKGADKGIGPVIMDKNCTNCGRCIDVCAKDVFKFSNRLNNNTLLNVSKKKEVAP
ncbi:MAG: quinol dehydrogenase ferredoxin subunit NapH [Woeseiaceae bacterium]